MEKPRDDNILDALVIGAGISGMTTAIDMIRLGNGKNFVILEKGYRVGGTWSDNEYPGCCCDVWSHTQPEIQRYLSGVAEKYDLLPHIHFDTVVERCVFDPKIGIWTLTARRGKGGQTRTYRARFVVSAVGQLNQPKYPEIRGMDNYQGKVMHSARWDASVELKGKRIAVIGNGMC
jgi:cation diffusion facilitator CzcD-associated flavoprotein CzcO